MQGWLRVNAQVRLQNKTDSFQTVRAENKYTEYKADWASQCSQTKGDSHTASQYSQTKKYKAGSDNYCDHTTEYMNDSRD